MAAGLMKLRGGDTVEVHSAGSQPGRKINELSAASLAEVGVDITGEKPKPVTEGDVRAADLVVTLGREAHGPPAPGTRFEDWDTDEPSERGIEGMERMRLVRVDIDRRVQDLLTRLASGPRQ
jgi:arsenate-mycothiol transferase